MYFGTKCKTFFLFFGIIVYLIHTVLMVWDRVIFLLPFE